MEWKPYFSEEFKRDAVQLLMLNAKTVSQLEEQFEIPTGMVAVWQQELQSEVCNRGGQSVGQNDEEVGNE